MLELVEHPKRYNATGKKECWEEMRDIFGDEAVCIYDCLSAYKYHYRAGLKDGNPAEQDEAKIKEYIKHCSHIVNDNMLLASSVYDKIKGVIK